MLFDKMYRYNRAVDINRTRERKTFFFEHTGETACAVFAAT